MPEYIPQADFPENIELDDFTRAYLECAEWCGIDDGDQSQFDRCDHPVWSVRACRQAAADCRDFRAANATTLAQSGLSDASAGHNFWHTRNGHDTGYWDCDLPGDTGKFLTDAADIYDGVNVSFYRGRLYLDGE